MRYFFVKKKDIEGDQVTIRGEEFKHIKNVLRAKIHDKIVVITGDGEEYHSLITKIRTQYILAKITKITRKTKEPGLYTAIAIAPPKAQRMNWFVEKAVEIGVSEIIPIVTNRSIVIPSPSKVRRWKRIAISAIKQSERSYLPAIRETTPFEELMSISLNFLLRFIAYEKERKKVIEEYHNERTAGKVLILIGPEGGFEDYELTTAIEKGFVPITLGSTKLRTETAGIVSLSRLLAPRS